MTPQPHPRVAWLLLALLLCCWAVTGRASFWLQLDEESAKQLRADLARVEADLKAGKLPTVGGRQLADHFASRLRELEEQLPIRRQWARIGRADAHRDLAQGKLRLYSIDRGYFPGTLCGPEGPPLEVWNRAMQELTGATVLPITPEQLPHKPRLEEFWLLVARVDGYNEVVRAYLTARHGADIFERVKSRAMRARKQSGLWGQIWDGVEQFVPFFAALFALLLLARLVELRKRRMQACVRTAAA